MWVLALFVSFLIKVVFSSYASSLSCYLVGYSMMDNSSDSSSSLSSDDHPPPSREKRFFFTNDHFTISDYVDDLGVLNPAIEELNLSLSSNDRIVKVNKKVSTYISNNIIK